MNYLDIIIVVVIIYNTFKGALRGLIKILFDLIAITGGFVFALNYTDTLAPEIINYLTISAKYANPISFILLWGLFFAGTTFVGILISKMVKATFLGAFDALGGLLLGTLKGSLIVLVFLLPLIHFNLLKTDNSLVLSRLKTPLLKLSTKIQTNLASLDAEKPLNKNVLENLSPEILKKLSPENLKNLKSLNPEELKKLFPNT
jgi:uncharacterized membrane protein required for colicin V production